MGKGKPRRDPNKKQNNYGNWCSACDEIDGKLYCEACRALMQLKYAKVILIIALRLNIIKKQQKVI